MREGVVAVVSAESLRTLDALGPFFAVHTHAEPSELDEPWRPMSEIVDDPDVLRERVRGVRSRLAGRRPAEDVELRVAASVTHLGLVARLVSPILAVAVRSGELLDPDLRTIRWQPELGGAFPLSVPAAASAGTSPDVFAHRVFDGPVRQLGEAAGRFSVAQRVLWGNVASAVNGAVSILESGLRDSGLRDRGLRDRAATARAFSAALLERAPLQGTSTVVDGAFRRRSCCLIYRAAPGRDGPICGDCVLAGNR